MPLPHFPINFLYSTYSPSRLLQDPLISPPFTSLQQQNFVKITKYVALQFTVSPFSHFSLIYSYFLLIRLFSNILHLVSSPTARNKKHTHKKLTLNYRFVIFQSCRIQVADRNTQDSEQNWYNEQDFPKCHLLVTTSRIYFRPVTVVSRYLYLLHFRRLYYRSLRSKQRNTETKGETNKQQQRQCTYNVNTGPRSPNNCCSKNISQSYIFVCVCVCARARVCVRVRSCVCGCGCTAASVCLRACSLINPACDTPRYCDLRPLWLHHIFPHYLKKGTIFGKKLLNVKCVL